MKTTQLLLAALLSACGNYHPYDYKGVSFTAKSDFHGREETILHDLNERYGCRWIGHEGVIPVSAVVDEDYLNAKKLLGETQQDIAHPEHGAPMTIRHAPTDAELEAMPKKYADAWLLQWQVVFIHEFGHALGLSHTSSGLMRLHYDDSVTYEEAQDQLIMLLEESGHMPECLDVQKQGDKS